MKMFLSAIKNIGFFIIITAIILVDLISSFVVGLTIAILYLANKIKTLTTRAIEHLTH